MSLKKVFISGSISVKKLNQEIIENLKNIMSKNYHILVGDASGIDTLVQDYCLKNNYFDVTVYSITSIPRYKASHKFSICTIEVSNEIKKERERQSFKDIAMSDESDFCFVVWDGKSKGSYANILRAIESKKFIKVFYIQENKVLEQNKILKHEIDFIYRSNNGYTASEVVEYLNANGHNKFNNTQSLNKYLLEQNVLKKDKIYIPFQNYIELFIIEMHQGKPSGVKFKNEFINWIETKLHLLHEQGEFTFD